MDVCSSCDLCLQAATSTRYLLSDVEKFEAENNRAAIGCVLLPKRCFWAGTLSHHGANIWPYQGMDHSGRGWLRKIGGIHP